MRSAGLAALVLATTATACTAGMHAGGLVRVGGPPPPPSGVHVGVSAEIHIDFFGVPLDGAQDVVFVLDRSGSMSLVSTGFAGESVGMSETESVLASLGGSLVNSAVGKPLPSKLEAAKEELIDTLRHMPDGTRFNVIFFDDQLAVLSPTMMILEPGTRAEIEAFIVAIEPGGSTAAVPALDLAYSLGAQRVVLLSDGLANSGGSGDELLDRARAQMSYGVRFDTIGIGLDQDAALMQTLAADSGGIAVMR
jgi:hypothetical protein